MQRKIQKLEHGLMSNKFSDFQLKYRIGTNLKFLKPALAFDY